MPRPVAPAKELGASTEAELELKQERDAAGNNAGDHSTDSESDASDLLDGSSSDLDDDVADAPDAACDVLFQPEDTLDFSHLADDYQAPLFVYPAAARPRPALAAAYDERAAARETRDAARMTREAEEIAMASELGRLHSQLRESRERQAAARARLRKQTLRVYEAELAEAGDRCEFNAMLGRLRSYAKTHRGVPISDTGGDLDEEGWVLAEWVRGRQEDHEKGQLPAHHLTALSAANVPFPVSEEDRWQRSLRQFQQYAADYWDHPILVQATDGDLLRSVAASPSEDHTVLQAWCRTQQEDFQRGGLPEGRRDRLLDAGFTFDVAADDDRWDAIVQALVSFRRQFGHVRVPPDYRSPDAPPADPDEPGLGDVAARLRLILYRDALAPRRRASLRRAAYRDLYLDLGGRVFEHHARHCQEGREERGEAPRVKRKFAALALMAEKDHGRGRAKKVRTRGTIQNWNAKLESELSPSPPRACAACSSCRFSLRPPVLSRARRAREWRRRRQQHPKRHQAPRLDLLPHP